VGTTSADQQAGNTPQIDLERTKTSVDEAIALEI
jgi:hypothetical protein